MNNLTFFVLLFVVAIGVSSCAKSNPETTGKLNEVERLVFADLDSALIVLKGVRPEDLSDRATRARYALLLTIADDRTGKAHTTLDDILAARDYFVNSSASDSMLAIVHMYVGRVHEDLGEPAKALESYLLAESHVDKTVDNSYWKGRIAYNIANLYYADFDYARSLFSLDRAIQHFSDHNDDIGVAHSHNLAGRNHLLLGDYQQALKALGKASEIYLDNNHTEGLLSNASSIADIYLSDLGDVLKADSVLRYAHRNFNNGAIPLSHFPLMSMVEAGKGNYTDAIRFLRDCMEIDPDLSPEKKATYKYYISTYLYDSGQYSSAYDHLQEYNSIADSLYNVEVAAVLQEVEKRYEKQELENEYRAYRKLTLYRVAIGLICLLVFISILWYVIWKRRQRILYLQADLDGMKSQMSEFENLKKNLSVVLDKHTEKETRLHDVLTNKMLHVQRLVDYLFLYENNPDEFKKKVSTAVIQAEKDRYFGELQEIVNEKYAGVVDYLKERYPTLSDDELNICCLICFGFNNNQIGILFGYTNSNSIFNKRHKLRKKMGLWPNYDSLEAYLSQLKTNLMEGSIPIRSDN